MKGAIIGDIIGSRYEFDNTSDHDFELFGPGCDYTDNTICTVAVADAVLRDLGYAEALRAWCRRYPHPRGEYDSYFFDWVNRPDPYPYNSFGNDSAMRVSPIAWFYDNEDEVRLQAEASAAVTHNHPEGIKGAVAIAVAILRIRQAPVKDPYIFEDVADEFYYDEYTCSEAFDMLPERGYFDATCQGCVPLSLYIAATATSFEDAIRQAVSYGGDSDAVGAIVGSLAEARFHVPPEMLATAMSLLPAEMRRIVDAFDAHLGR